jgi:hypothetical protein
VIHNFATYSNYTFYDVDYDTEEAKQMKIEVDQQDMSDNGINDRILNYVTR